MQIRKGRENGRRRRRKRLREGRLKEPIGLLLRSRLSIFVASNDASDISVRIGSVVIVKKGRRGKEKREGRGRKEIGGIENGIFIYICLFFDSTCYDFI